MSAAVESRPFDVCGPLPEGVTVLEASAGTGKTYTIAALAARYVAAGVELERLLLVTFTRMATGELRERVRERLVSTEAGLERALAGVDPGPDEVVRLLAAGAPEAVAERRERLARALADFDAATIATTHGFCQEVLGGLGVSGDVEPDTAFVEDLGDLIEEVTDDLYVRRFAPAHAGAPAFKRAEALRIVRMAVEANPSAPIAGVMEGADPAPGMRRRLAEAARVEVEARKRRLAVMTYDDLLTRLRTTLAGAPAAAQRLRERYRVVLVDEFQDTDPVQWEILQRAFAPTDERPALPAREGRAGRPVTLVLIGDPKQAIYAFRGADVYAYLRAANVAGTRATLDVNWRSDQALIDAYDALFGGAQLGHPGIVYRHVRAAPAHREPRLRGAPVSAPLRVRLVDRDIVGCTPGGYASTAEARTHIHVDLAADVTRLLASAASVGERQERVRPRDVAVLVRSNRNAGLVRDALEASGVPAVVNGAGSVFATGPALEWLRLLEALERPASDLRAHAAALTAFLGWSAERVATADDEQWEDVHQKLHAWARLLRTRGVAALAERIGLAEGLPGRVLGAARGERRLTDLRHVAHLLHEAATTQQLGIAALTQWLRRRIEEADRDAGDEDRSRRLESDDEAIQVLTIHRSKGLEFPIVYFPDLWEGPPKVQPGEPVAFHDALLDDERWIDVALAGPDYRRHRDQYIAELRGEDLRLAYVALTRARHQAVLWWANAYGTRDAALARLLFFRAADGTVPASGRTTPADAQARERFEQLAADAPGCVSVEDAALGMPGWWARPPSAAVELRAARFDRALDRGWRRTSYSDITAGAYESRVASEPEEPAVVTDEPAAGVPAPPVPSAAGEDEAALRGVESLLGAVPAGVHVGTHVHRVLERTDFAAADLEAELRGHVAQALAWRPVELGSPETVVAGLRAAIETPLGPLAGGARLRDLTHADRLDELGFELPIAGGDVPTGRLPLPAVGALLRAHLPADDPLAGYADRLEDPAIRDQVRGYLTGSIDLVARVDGRFAVVDYKTNRLGAPDEALTAWHHRPSALAAEMERAHYALQALLYTAALHRYLRWRLPGYDPERHLAGVLYLFLRGMTGPDTPVVDGTPCGVFAWRPPSALVEGLSELLEWGRP